MCKYARLACMLDIIMYSGVNTVLNTMINWIMDSYHGRIKTCTVCMQLKYTLIIGKRDPLVFTLRYLILKLAILPGHMCPGRSWCIARPLQWNLQAKDTLGVVHV